MPTFDVTWDYESETALAIDRDAAILLRGAGTLEITPTGLVIVGDLLHLSKGAIVLAGLSALASTFLFAMMLQAERFPPAVVVAMIVLLALAVAAFLKRKRTSHAHRIVAPWSDVGRFTETSEDTWSISLTRTVGSVSCRATDAAAVHDAVAAAAELGVVAVTFGERVVPLAVAVTRGD